MKRIIISLMLVAIVLSSFSKYGNTFIIIPSDKRLIYDIETKIIYAYYKSWGLSVYYSKNGKLCRYNEETNTIEEIK